jgi:drug/metabolite transporter (DMT)-like permease
VSVYLSIACGGVAMLSYGIANAWSKPLSQKHGPERLLFLRGLGVSLLLAACAVRGTRLESLWAAAGAIMLGIAGYVPVLAYTHAVRNSRIGIVAPVAGTAPLITVVLAWLLIGAPLSGAQWLAIVVVVLANIAASVDFRNWRESTALQLSSGIPLALVAALGWGLFYFFLIPATRALGPWLSACLAEIGVNIAAGVHVWSRERTLPLKGAADPWVLLNAVLLCVGTVAFTIGVDQFNVGIVAALANSTALVATLIGWLAFKESLTLKEKVAAVAMIAGVAIMPLGQ